MRKDSGQKGKLAVSVWSGSKQSSYDLSLGTYGSKNLNQNHGHREDVVSVHGALFGNHSSGGSTRQDKSFYKQSSFSVGVIKHRLSITGIENSARKLYLPQPRDININCAKKSNSSHEHT